VTPQTVYLYWCVAAKILPSPNGWPDPSRLRHSMGQAGWDACTDIHPNLGALGRAGRRVWMVGSFRAEIVFSIVRKYYRLSKIRISIGVQLAALILASAAVMWGIAAAYSVAFPGPSGEWAVLAVYASYAVNVPVGLTALGIGLLVKRGSARLRRICIVVSLVVLWLPILASLISWGRRHW